MEKMQYKIKLTKVSDDVFNGKHPNGINDGHTHIGFTNTLPKVGEAFYIGTLSTYFHTSVVIEIVNENTFHTLNSVYKYEILNAE